MQITVIVTIITHKNYSNYATNLDKGKAHWERTTRGRLITQCLDRNKTEAMWIAPGKSVRDLICLIRITLNTMKCLCYLDQARYTASVSTECSPT